MIALGTEARTVATLEATSAFGTPTVVHFCAVLLLAAIVSTPRHTPVSLSLCLGGSGVAGLAYVIRVVVLARRQKGYAPVFSDWVWHIGLPVVAYACLFVAGALLSRQPIASLYVVAPTALLLLFIGIHNAWDAAVWMAAKRTQS